MGKPLINKFFTMSCTQTTSTISPVYGNCAFKPGQAYRVLFQLVYSTGTTLNGIGISSVTSLASWSPFYAASDGTKIIPTDIVGGGKVTPGNVKEFGGGNETPGGSPIPIGKSVSKFTGKMFQTVQSAIKELKKLEEVKGLGVYFVSPSDKVTGKKVSVSGADKLCPIPLEQLPYFLDAEMGEQETPVSNEFGFYLPVNYSDTIDTYECVGLKDLAS